MHSCCLGTRMGLDTHIQVYYPHPVCMSFLACTENCHMDLEENAKTPFVYQTSELQQDGLFYGWFFLWKPVSSYWLHRPHSSVIRAGTVINFIPHLPDSLLKLWSFILILQNFVLAVTMKPCRRYSCGSWTKVVQSADSSVRLLG